MKQLIFLLCLFCTTVIHGQTFRAGASGGMNFSQINGDFLAGYDKAGLQAGVFASFPLSSRFSLRLELNYSQRGSSNKLFGTDRRYLRLDYAEIPVALTIGDWWQEEEQYHKVMAEAGASVGRLFQSKTNYNEGQAALDVVNKTDVSFFAGGVIWFSSSLGFNIRYTSSINRLVNLPLDEPSGGNFKRLRGYFLTFRILYSF